MVMTEFMQWMRAGCMYLCLRTLLVLDGSWSDEDVVYFHAGNIYRFPKPVRSHRKDPRSIWVAFSKGGLNITHHLRQYLGPHENWHGCTITPATLGTTQVTVVHRMQNAPIDFYHNQQISVTL